MAGTAAPRVTGRFSGLLARERHERQRGDGGRSGRADHSRAVSSSKREKLGRIRSPARSARELRRYAQRLERRHDVERRRIDLDDVVYGVHAVEEALAAGEQLRALHVADERKRDPAVRKILDTARERNIRVRFENRAYFNQFPYKANQGVVAFGQPFPYLTLEEVMHAPRDGSALFVVLDHITDPHNAGAIIRTAECAGASAII